MIRFTSGPLGVLVTSVSRYAPENGLQMTQGQYEQHENGLMLMQDMTAAMLNDDQAAALLQWLLEPYGLELSPHQIESSWWGYQWPGYDWDGPYNSRKEALEAALDRAKKAILAQRDAPFAVNIGATIRWNGSEWESVENPQTREQALRQIIEGLFEIAAPGTVKNALWQTFQHLT